MQLRYSLRRLLPALLLALPLAARAQTPGVGIGTTAPDASAALDIVSSSKGALLPRVAAASAIASPATGLIVFQTNAPAGFYYNAGTPAAPSWQQLATAAGAAVTAGNGLTKTGQNIALGGALSQNTTLGLNGNSLEVNGATVSQQIAQLTTDNTTGTVAPGGLGQSFQLPAGATVRRVDVYGAGSGTFRLFSGTPSGSVLATQAVSYTPNQGLTSVVLTTPVTVGAAGTYSFQTGSSGGFAIAESGGYSGGTAYLGANSVNSWDLKFAVYYTTPTGTALYASSSGGVGLGTNAPTATLDVAGSTRLRGLPTAGVVTTDAQGNLSSSSTSGSFVLNQGATDQPGEFRLTGLGRAGSLLATGNASINTQGAHLQWNRSGGNGETWLLNQKGGGTSNAGIRFGKSDQADNITEFGRFIDNGFLGLGDFTNYGDTPLTRLSITPGITEAKITLYDGGFPYNHFGFGVSPGQLNYHVDVPASNHVFYAEGKNGNGTELMRIQGNGRVGIGTTTASGAPTALLDVNGSTRLRGLTTAGLVTTDASGNLGSTTTVGAADATTASNGLTRTGQDVQLGGTLSGATTLAQAGYALGLTGGNLGVGTATPGQRLSVVSTDNTASTDIVKVTSQNLASGVSLGYYGLRASGSNPNDPLTLDSKGSGPLLLNTGGSTGNVGIGTTAPNTRLSITPGSVEAKITLFDGGSTAAHYGFGISGGQLNYHVQAATAQHVFYAGGKNGDGTELLRIQGDGNVGIGTTAASGAPTQKLDVNGNVRVRTLGPGVVSASANGTLSSSDGSGSFVLNQSATDQTANFRISGTGAVGGNLGIGTTAPNYRLDLGPGYGSSATDAATKKLAVYNGAAGTDFYGLGVSGGYLHLFAGATSTGAPALSISNGGSVGVGTSSPRGRLDVAGSGDSYLVANPNNGGSQNVYLPGSLFLAPFSGTSGTAYVQARVPNPGSSTNLALTLRTTNSGALLDALQLKADGAVILPALGGSGTRVVVADNNGTLSATQALPSASTFVQNQSATDQAASFRIGGDGAIAGRLGLGTTTPSARLSVAGDVLVQGTNTASVTQTNAIDNRYATRYLATYVYTGQTFTLPTAGALTRLTVQTGNTTAYPSQLRIFNGSTLVYTQSVSVGPGLNTFTINTPVALPAGQHFFEFFYQGPSNDTNLLRQMDDTYAGGYSTYDFGSGPQSTGLDLYFRLEYTTTTTTAVPSLVVTTNGRVGVGTSSPGHPLTILADGSANGALLGLYDNYGTDKYNFSLAGGGLNLSESNVAGGRLFVQATSGNVGIGTTTPAYKLDVNGMIRGANVSPSDRRLKQDIRPLGPTLAQLLQLHGARYRWNALGVARGGEAGRAQIGLIAQEVEALYPELVSTDAEGYKAVNYAQLTPVLLEAIRELKADNDALRADAATDHAALQTLQQQMARLLGEAPAGTQARR
ncbi:tail fiber domain-containing protein [Hymenobacter sp. ASUV-10]|uniref:Tail fiber domain-containing protein n=1 Tax=Hymenobacter aranciens TaxID=3063996 RepID=A0ABT9BFW6_9BACT|nr:tail fiber domain-containing protein [Hymenobacter sp. ASUV-10]MDO7877159.1 tail fiber domain-containing protein [Hymenobacter sp. ASUV-10]